MTDDELESRLGRLGRSMSPGPGFAGRVLARVEPRWPFVLTRRAGWFTAAAVAALAMVVARVWVPGLAVRPGTVRQGPGLVRTSDQFETVSQRAVCLDGEVPARQVNCDLFERTRWANPQDHTSFERVVPLERSSRIEPIMY